ncbi:MAG: response regulator [bacterium]
MKNKEEFLRNMLSIFKIEAEEAIRTMTSNFIELEKNPPESRKAELVEATFRSAHSLKGASRAVNLTEIESVCQALESVFSKLKDKSLEPVPKIFDLFYLSVDLLNDILGSSYENISEEIKQRVAEITSNLFKVEAGKIEEIEISKPVVKPDIQKSETKLTVDDNTVKYVNPKPSIPESKNPSSEMIRVSIDKLDSLLFQVEEMLSLKLASFQHTVDIGNILKKLNAWNKESTEIFHSVMNINQKLAIKQKDGILSKEEKDLGKVIHFFDWANSLVNNIETELIELRKVSMQETYDTGSKIETLLEDVKNIISIPFSTILDVFPKVVRDLSKDVGKEAVLIIKGDNIEIDRRILEEIRSPLTHLLRNCIDHGIETPDVRKLKNKPEKGIININIDRLENNKVEITISDDGAGIDMEKLKYQYAKQENISAIDSDEINEFSVLNYIFKSGVSTNELVTDISGRGLGLAIVKEKIEEIGGFITVQTKKDEETQFKMQIPLSLVTFRGVQIRANNYEYIVPTAAIERALRVNKSDVKTIKNKATIPFEGKIIPLIHLTEILELPYIENDIEHILVMVLGNTEQHIGFAVDDILNEEEVLVKSFNKHLGRIRNISGASVLGSGKVIPILNVSDIIKTAMKASATKLSSLSVEKKKEKKAILVVEDSITSRMLLKNILESAGFSVAIAIDGIEGFTKLKEANYDLVVSDIDMPRMNGFDLTARIRADNSLAEKPVILVTSLSKREDRERGMEVGANAYIIKSDFDQTNLLDEIDRLIA